MTWHFAIMQVCRKGRAGFYLAFRGCKTNSASGYPAQSATVPSFDGKNTSSVFHGMNRPWYCFFSLFCSHIHQSANKTPMSHQRSKEIEGRAPKKAVLFKKNNHFLLTKAVQPLFSGVLSSYPDQNLGRKLIAQLFHSHIPRATNQCSARESRDSIINC